MSADERIAHLEARIDELQGFIEMQEAMRNDFYVLRAELENKLVIAVPNRRKFARSSVRSTCQLTKKGQPS